MLSDQLRTPAHTDRNSLRRNELLPPVPTSLGTDHVASLPDSSKLLGVEPRFPQRLGHEADLPEVAKSGDPGCVDRWGGEKADLPRHGDLVDGHRSQVGGQLAVRPCHGHPLLTCSTPMPRENMVSASSSPTTTRVAA